MLVRILKADASSAELTDRIFKARAAVGALELMERELAVIAKASALRGCKPQIAEIKRLLRSLITSLVRIAERSERQLRQREFCDEALPA